MSSALPTPTAGAGSALLSLLDAGFKCGAKVPRVMVRSSFRELSVHASRVPAGIDRRATTVVPAA